MRIVSITTRIVNAEMRNWVFVKVVTDDPGLFGSGEAMLEWKTRAPLGPISGVVALHFAVSTPNHVIQEEMVGAVPWYFDVVQGPIRRVDGFWQAPEAPGLGIEVNETACARHPFAPEVIHTLNAVLEDGTVVDW